jgi:hypothetical protein
MRIAESKKRIDAQIGPLMREADQIVAIMAASRKSAIANRHSAIR